LDDYKKKFDRINTYIEYIILILSISINHGNAADVPSYIVQFLDAASKKEISSLTNLSLHDVMNQVYSSMKMKFSTKKPQLLYYEIYRILRTMDFQIASEFVHDYLI